MPTTTYDCCTHIPIPTRSRKNKDTHPQLTPPLPHPTHSAFPLFTIMYNKYIWDSRELFQSHGTPSSRFSPLIQSLPGGSALALGSRAAPSPRHRRIPGWSLPQNLGSEGSAKLECPRNPGEGRDTCGGAAVNHPKHSTEHQ